MSEIDDLMLKHFGPQPDGMFLAIGRLSALTSVLDLWVRNLLATLVDDEPMEKYDNLSFHEHKTMIKERLHILPPELRKEVKRMLGRVTGLRGDRNLGVHTVWSRPGRGWRNDLSVKEGEPRRVLTTKIDQADLDAKVLKAARLLETLIDLQDRCNRLQTDRSYAKYGPS